MLPNDLPDFSLRSPSMRPEEVKPHAVHPGLVARGHASSHTFLIADQIEHPETAICRRIACPSRVNRLCSALFQRRVIEKRVRLGIENLVRQRRRFREIESDALNRAALDPLEQTDQAVDVHCLDQTVFDRLVDQRMARNYPVACDIFQAGKLVRKNCSQEVFRFHALQRRRDSCALPVAAAERGRAPHSIATG